MDIAKPVLVIIAACMFAVAQAAEPPKALGLDDFARMIDDAHPRLAVAAWNVESARGRALQAGKYPNPELSVIGDELSDVQGPGGIWTAPFFSQEFVTRGKLKLDRAAALREVDQRSLQYCAERYALLTLVRQSYFDILTLQRRLETLNELVALAEKSVAGTQRLVDARQAARLDLLQLEVELERVRAEREAAQRALPAAFRRLAAAVSQPDLPMSPLVGPLELPPPEYDLESLARQVRDVHPEAMAARVAVDRARVLLRRAEVEVTPNIKIGGGYMRQNQNRSNDWTIAVSLPVPLWNRNQGNIRAARAEIGGATHEVGKIELELVDRVATAHGEYAAARARAERYRMQILPRARESYELSAKAFAGGQFDYLKVLAAQRAVAEANLEFIKSAGESWRAAAALAGLLLEETWPLVR